MVRGLGGSLSPRIRALIAAIERSTDFHFPTLAAQVLCCAAREFLGICLCVCLALTMGLALVRVCVFIFIVHHSGTSYQFSLSIYLI